MSRSDLSEQSNVENGHQQSLGTQKCWHVTLFPIFGQLRQENFQEFWYRLHSNSLCQQEKLTTIIKHSMQLGKAFSFLYGHVNLLGSLSTCVGLALIPKGSESLVWCLDLSISRPHHGIMMCIQDC